MYLQLIPLLLAAIGPIGPDAPAREPQLAVQGSTVVLAFGAGQAIYFSRSSDSGASFSPPVKVAEAAVVPLTRHRGPRIAFAGSAIVITAVAGKTAAAGPHAHGLPSDGDLLAWRSEDGGKTWSRGTVVNDVPGAPREGLHALAAGPAGNLFAAWLDKRDGKTKLYGSQSVDGGRTWSPNVLVYASPDGTICECCHPSAAFRPDGSILVMWRNSLDGLRDLYLAQSKDRVTFQAAQKLGNGTWKLNACPMDGGGIAVSRGVVYTAWRREHSLFLDTPGQPEKELGEGIDVALAAGANGIYVIWSTPEGIVVMTPKKEKPQPLGEKGAFPTVAPIPGGRAIAAWEDAGRIVIRTIE